MDALRRIADAVLYEGYLLWPYRRSALKNHKRWTIGGVLPEAYCVGRDDGDRWIVRAECPIEPGEGSVTVSVRFLHTVRRDLLGSDGGEAAELTVAGRRRLAGEEATEREFTAEGLDLAALGETAADVAIEVPAGHDTEWLEEPPGRRAGAVVRSWRALRGAMTVSARDVGDALLLTVEVRNTTPGVFANRADALPAAFASAHVVATAVGGRFISLIDPPARLREIAGRCRNAGLWPVLIGAEGASDTVLAAPIVLPDDPKIAPESLGDRDDATEIDQLLTLSILTLTEEERQEIRDSDPRGRAILDRIDAMTPEELTRLHGAIREYRPLDG